MERAWLKREHQVLELSDQLRELSGSFKRAGVRWERGAPSGAREQLECAHELVDDQVEIGARGTEFGPRACRARGVQEERRAFAQEAAGERELIAPARIHEIVLARAGERIELADQRVHTGIVEAYTWVLL